MKELGNGKLQSMVKCDTDFSLGEPKMLSANTNRKNIDSTGNG